MAQEATRKFLGAFEQWRKPTMFLSSFFKTGPNDIFDAESVEIQVRRHGQRVAAAVHSIGSTSRYSDIDQHSVKVFTPPAFNEGFVVNGLDAMKVQFGKTLYDEVDFVASALMSFTKNAMEKEDAILRAIELMASQVLQTGTVTLIDPGGATIGTLDYKPKNTHFFNASVNWATSATAVPLVDMETLGDLVRADSGYFPSIAIMGNTAWTNFSKCTTVKDSLDNRRMELGTIMPKAINSTGAKYQGTVSVGAYTVEIWTYPASFNHIQTGANTPYITADSCIMLSPDAVLTMAYGGFPTPLLEPDPRLARFKAAMPTRVPAANGFVDLHPKVWASADGDSIEGAVRCRPLPIPVDIDSFGCINTTP